MKQLLPVLKKRHRTRPVYNLGLSHCLASLRGSKMENCPTGRKMDRLHKFAPCKDSAHLQKLRSKSGQRRKMPHLPSYLHPCFLVCKCVIYHLCPIFTPLVVTNLRHICKEQICSNPFFRPIFELRRGLLVVVV